jgi:octaprenyl-diphosphate synthase
MLSHPGRRDLGRPKRRVILRATNIDYNAEQEPIAPTAERHPMISSTLAASQPDLARAQASVRDVYDLVADDFAAVNALIPRQLTSDVLLVERIGTYIVESGGKRLRPLLVLLGARCLGYRGDAHVKLATIIEFLHTATLLHDDVVDRSDLRRGRATANVRWGNAPSVLVGDFLYSRAFQLMVQLQRMDIITILSDATNVIAAGEVQQLDNIGKTAISEPEYMEVIGAKTAMLFQAAAHTAAVLADSDGRSITALRSYGLHLGLAYQLVDDWLDYAGDPRLMGKNAGTDLAEGKVTLPLIHTLNHGAAQDMRLVQIAIQQRSAHDLEAVLRAVQRSGALEYTRHQAEWQARLALQQLDALPENPHQDALATLARFCVARLN